jgi:cytochrome c553
MKHIARILAALAIVCGPVTTVSWGMEGDGFGQRFADQNCSWCHGGPSFQGYTTAPRLAGQRPEYLANELMTFKRHARDNPLSQQNM